MLELVEEEPDVDHDDVDGDNEHDNGNNYYVVVVLEHEEPPQDGCLADPLGPHHHQLGSVLFQEHGFAERDPQSSPRGRCYKVRK